MMAVSEKQTPKRKRRSIRPPVAVVRITNRRRTDSGLRKRPPQRLSSFPDLDLTTSERSDREGTIVTLQRNYFSNSTTSAGPSPCIVNAENQTVRLLSVRALCGRVAGIAALGIKKTADFYCGRNVSVSLSVPFPPDDFVPSTDKCSFVVPGPIGIVTASAEPGS